MSPTLTSKTFCKEGPSAEEKIKTLRSACKRHTALTKECSMGQGQDRWVLGTFDQYVAVLLINPTFALLQTLLRDVFPDSEGDQRQYGRIQRS
jgi:hypothetical protein